ncbi:hypothetical protein BMETH_911_0 [methanotrophic bacterial endosymbiont of Bathymodiolus sp.]|nr:hypothetical protein BMETH_911_0 [methanotrophic bacterial endosymbiont of Bathymodiolus sp.]
MIVNNDKQIYHLDSLTITENASQDQLQLLATGKSGANKIKFNGILSLLDDGNNILGITQDSLTGLIEMV